MFTCLTRMVTTIANNVPLGVGNLLITIAMTAGFVGCGDESKNFENKEVADVPTQPLKIFRDAPSSRKFIMLAHRELKDQKPIDITVDELPLKFERSFAQMGWWINSVIVFPKGVTDQTISEMAPQLWTRVKPAGVPDFDADIAKIARDRHWLTDDDRASSRTFRIDCWELVVRYTRSPVSYDGPVLCFDLNVKD